MTELIYTPEYNNNKSLFYYKSNVMSEEQLSVIIQWINKQNFKNGYWLNGKEIPRKHIWFQENNKNFCESWKHRYDRWNSENYDSILNKIQDNIQSSINPIINKFDWINESNINSCLVNLYSDENSSIKPHRDTADSFGLYPTITIFSIGDSRNILIKDTKNINNPFNKEIKLEHNSLFIMGGYSQENFTHEIPKELKKKNERYSLTFREYLY